MVYQGPQASSLNPLYSYAVIIGPVSESSRKTRFVSFVDIGLAGTEEKVPLSIKWVVITALGLCP